MLRTSLAAALLLLSPLAQAQTPQKLGYQGRLLKADGTPESGMVKLVFRVYDAETAGQELWREEQTLGLTDGFYATFLGEKTAFPPGTFDGTERYLEVVVEDTPLLPRQKVASVAYALHSASATQATSLKGGTVDATSINVGGKPVIDSMGNLVGGIAGNFANKTHTHDAAEVASGKLDLLRLPTGPGSKLDADTVDGQEAASFVLKTDLSNPGTLNAATNPVDWTRLKNVPPSLAAGTISASAPLAGAGTPTDPLRIGPADATAPGVLAPADYTRFGAKLDKVAVTAPLAGEGTTASPLVLGKASATGDGFLASADFLRFDQKLGSVAVTGPLSGAGTTASPLALGRANASADGYLASTDFTAFNNKLGSVAVSGPLGGAGTTASPLTLGKASDSADGYLAATDFAAFSSRLASVAVAAPLTGDGSSGSPLTLARASGTVSGFLHSSDFATFNSKLSSVAVSGPLSGAGTTASPLALARASATVDGYLAATDFAAFNNKVGSVAAPAAGGLAVSGSASAPSLALRSCLGGQILKFNATTSAWECAADAGGSGTVTAVTASGPLASSGGATPNLTLARATGTADGYLAGTDFATFSAKLGAVAVTAPLTGSGTSGSPLALARASGSGDGFLAAADFSSFSSKVGSVGAGTGVTIGGTATAPTVAVVYGTTAGTAVEGNDSRLTPGNYIQNQTGMAQAASFSINGDGLVGGKVGIGTAGVPTDRLEVAGVVRAQGYKSSDGSAGVSGVFTVGSGNVDVTSASLPHFISWSQASPPGAGSPTGHFISNNLDDQYGWHCSPCSLPSWGGVDFGSSARIISTLRLQAHGNPVRDFQLQGSNDSTNGTNGTWTPVLTATMTERTEKAWQTFPVNNVNAYRWYRLYVTSMYSTGWALYEWELLEGGVRVLTIKNGLITQIQ